MSLQFSAVAIAPVPFRSGDDGVLAEGLQRAHLENSHVQAVRFQQVDGFDGFGEHVAGRDDRGVPPVRDEVGHSHINDVTRPGLHDDLQGGLNVVLEEPSGLAKASFHQDGHPSAREPLLGFFGLSQRRTRHGHMMNTFAVLVQPLFVNTGSVVGLNQLHVYGTDVTLCAEHRVQCRLSAWEGVLKYWGFVLVDMPWA